HCGTHVHIDKLQRQRRGRLPEYVPSCCDSCVYRADPKRCASTRRLFYPQKSLQSPRVVGVSVERDPRKRRWNKRIDNHKNRTTSAIAAAGTAKARKDIRSAPPSSAVAMTELPRPPVKTVELALSTAVTPCVRPAMPPPAITAAVHLTIGGTSVMTAADTIVPATSAAGVAKLSSRLSTPGM